MRARAFFNCILAYFLVENTNLLSQELYEVDILHSDFAILETINGEALKNLSGNVKLKHKNTYIDCDSAVVYLNNNIDAIGHVIMKRKNMTVRGEFLQYFSNQKLAVLNNNIVLTDKKAKLYTQDLTYDLTSDMGYYMKGGKLVNEKTEITSQFGSYYSNTSQVLFRQNVHVNHPDYQLTSDSLLYDTKLKKSIFKSSTKITNDSGYIWCNSGWYDEENKRSSFGRGTYIFNPPQWILTDSILTDKKIGMSFIYKTFEYHDTALKIHVFGDSAVMYDDNKNITAFKRATLVLESEDNKPTFIRADILESKTVEKKKNLRAIKNVRLYNNDFQGVADTMLYTDIDSLMIFKKNPIIWHKMDQISGDVIHLYTSNKKPKKMNVYGNAFMIQKEEMYAHYNQICGDTTLIDFKSGEIEQMNTIGNANSLYYGKEEGKGYIGINVSESHNLKAIFDSSKVKKIIFYQNPKAIFYPLKEITDSNRFLPKFKWEEALKPKNKDDI